MFDLKKEKQTIDIKLVLIDDENSAEFGIKLTMENYLRNNVKRFFEILNNKKMVSNIEKYLFNINYEIEFFNFSEIDLKSGSVLENISMILEDDLFITAKGIILDFNLIQTSILKDSEYIWKEIKTRNNNFPLVMLTGHIDGFKGSRINEVVFEKNSSDENMKKIFDCLTEQIKNNYLEIYNRLSLIQFDKANKSFSGDVLLLETANEQQFSLNINENVTKNNETINELVEKAYKILKDIN